LSAARNGWGRTPLLGYLHWGNVAAPGHRSGVRGRPPRPARSTLHRPGWFECEDRIAWLLRANRLYGPHRITAAAFAAAFHGGSFPQQVGVSQISKWETAASRIRLAVLRRYEELLELEPHHLVAVADWIYRDTTGSIGAPLLTRGIDPENPRVHQRIDELLERALSTDVMSGPDWDELTVYLSALPAVHLHPRQVWTELTERLLAELLVADGRAWLLRTEALKRLMANPRARAPIIAACGAVAADPTHQVVIEPLAILDMTRDPDANRHVLTQLRHPTSDRALRGALLACLQKVTRHHFPPADLRLLTTTAADLLTIDDMHADTRQHAASLLRRVFSTNPTLARGRRVTDPAVRAILTYGRTAAPATVDHVVDRLSAAVMAALPADRPVATDPMLSRLLRDLLYSPNSDDRLSAGQLIAATPLKEPVASALATELTTAVAARVPELAVSILAAMPFVGRPVDRVAIERFITVSDCSPAVAESAAWAIGHVPGRSDSRFWHAAIQTRLRGHRPESAVNLSVLRGLVYGLGIGGERTTLDALRADPQTPRLIRTAAAWWLNIPTRISASALR
jgi:hypothetical protein